MSESPLFGIRPVAPRMLSGADLDTSPGATAPPSTGMIGWWRADDLGLTDGTAVATWTDTSGTGTSLTQATSGARPLYRTNVINGHAVVRFDGTDDFLGGTITSTAQPTTFVYVFKAAVTAANQDVVFTGHEFLIDPGGQVELWGGASILPTGLTHPGTAFDAIMVNFNSTTSASTRFNASYPTGAVGTDPTGTTIRFGNHGSQARFLNGDIAEVLVYNRTLTADEQAQVWSYVNGRYFAAPVIVSGDAAVTGAGTVTAAAGQGPAWTGEGGTNTTGITTGNSGGASGAAFNTVTLGTGATAVYDNTHTRGALAAKLATAGTAADCSLEYSTALGARTQAWFRAYFYIPSNPATPHRLIDAYDSGSGQLCFALYLTAAGKLQSVNTTGTQIQITTGSVPLNAWFRVEMAVTGSATVGQVEVMRFDSADSTTATETITSAATQNTRGSFNNYRFGSAGDPMPASRTLWLDDLGISTGGYLGPTTAATVANGAATVTGAGTTTAAATQGSTATATGVGAATAAAQQSSTSTATGAGTATAAGAVIVPGAATVTGAGSVTAAGSAAGGGTATVTGAGSVTATVVQVAGSAVTGAGSVTATVVQRGQASVTGAGATSASAVQQATASATGAGTATANAGGTASGTSAVTGAGSVTATVVQAAIASVTGAGTVTAAAVQGAAASAVGAGSVTAAVVQRASATVTGTGSVVANSNGSATGAASVTGAGVVTATAVQGVTATAAGAGTVTAAATVTVAATASVSGAGATTAAVVQRASATVTGAGSVTANAQGTTAGAATVTGAGSASAVATVTQRATATATGAGTTTAAGSISGAASVAGAGVASAAVVQRVVATVTGTGSVVASVGQTIVGTAGAAGAGSVVAAGRTKYTTRPYTGITVRPSVGTYSDTYTDVYSVVTTRPNTGITVRP